jgi:sialate O-acetylesterase
LKQSADQECALLNVKDDQLRLFNFKGAARGGSGVYNQDLLDHLRPENFSSGVWQRSNPFTGSDFSAVGYYFARRLRVELNCPVGIINVSIGGTPIESWISESSLHSHPELSQMVNGNWLHNPVLDQWCKKRARFNLKRGLSGELEMPADQFGPNHSFKPGFMYAAASARFQPMAIKGVLWYQGESNADSRERISQYNTAFPLLVDSWRSGFDNETLPFAFVQLPAMGRSYWPVFREQQRRILNGMTNVGMAITIDTGHPTNVHPNSKRPVGERLAQWALVKCYGQNGPAMGPLYQSKSINGEQLVLHFDSVGDGLVVKGDMARHFELAGGDGEFHPAKAQVGQDKVTLTSDSVPRPVHARYAWHPFPDPPVNLFNSAGIPASPFTTSSEF